MLNRQEKGNFISLLTIIVTIVLGLTQIQTSANTINDIPYNDSFEDYSVTSTNGTDVIGTNGWYGIVANVALVITNSYSFGYEYPLNTETHNQNLYYVDSTWNPFNYTERTNIWVDIMVQAIPTIAPPTEIATNALVALYMNTNGHFVVRHAYYAEDFSTHYETWTELNHPPVASGNWARVTVMFDFMTDQAPDKHFAISINGSEPISNALAYSTFYMGEDLPVAGGIWFYNADSCDGGGNWYVSSVALEGIGMIDDFVVTDVEPPEGGGGETVTAQGTPYTWLDQYGLTDHENDDLEDQDGDGLYTWQEYLAGTIPTNKGSVFQVLDITRINTSNRIVWYGTTNTGIYTPFLMYRSTNLIYGWSLIPTNIPRSGADSNIWWDQAVPAMQSIWYRPAVPTNH